FVVGLLVSSALSHAVIAPLAYLGITALEGQCITPTLLGHRLTINPFLVFLSIACWSWSLVRDGGGAAAVLDRRRECRPTRDCGCSGALGERRVTYATILVLSRRSRRSLINC